MRGRTMRWAGDRESGNVEDRRGFPATGMAFGGGIGSLVIALAWLLLGGDPAVVLNQNPPPAARQQAPPGPEDDKLKHFVSVVLADTEDVWSDLFPAKFGKPYRDPKLV